jgi:hypothetical protein
MFSGDGKMSQGQTTIYKQTLKAEDRVARTQKKAGVNSGTTEG